MQTSAVPAHHDGVSDVLHCVLATRVEELVPLAITLASLRPDDRVLVIAPNCLLATLPESLPRHPLAPDSPLPDLLAVDRIVRDRHGECDFYYLRAGVRLPHAGLARLAELAATDPAIALVSPLSGRRPDLSPLADGVPEPDLEDINRWLADNAVHASFDLPGCLDSCAWVRAGALARVADSGMPPERALAERGDLIVACAQCYVDDRAVLGTPRAAAPDPTPDGLLARLRAMSAGTSEHLPQRVVRLHLSHSWGGGVATWLADFAAADTRGQNLVLRAVSGWDARGHSLELYLATRMDEALARWSLEHPIDASVITHHRYKAILRDVITLTGASSIIVSSLVGHSLDGLDTGLPTLLVQHDYYPYCSALFLYHDGVCRECGPQRLSSCLADNPLNIRRGQPEAGRWMALRSAFAERLHAGHVTWVAPSAAVFTHLAAIDPRLGGKPGHVIEHGIDLGLPRTLTPRPPAADAGTARPRLFVLGRLAPHKGQALLLAALPELLAEAELVLVGCGTFCTPFEGTEGVHIVPDYHTRDLPDLVAQWHPDAALFLSLVPETFSYTLSEVMALGLPPVATRAGALATRIEHGVNGFLFEPNAAALVTTVRSILRDPGPLHQIAAQLAAQPVRGRDDMVADYLRLLPAAAAGAHMPAAGLIEALLESRQDARHARDAQRDRDTLLGRVTDLDRALAEQAQHTRAQATEIDTLRSERSTALATLASVQACLDTQQALLEAQTRELAAQRERESGLVEREAGLIEGTAALRASLDTLQDALHDSRAQAEAYRLEVDARGRHIDAIGAELASVRHRQDALLASTSWRMTAPLRRLVETARLGSARARLAVSALRALPGVVARAGGPWPAARKLAQVVRTEGLSGLKRRARLRVAIDSDSTAALFAAPSPAAAATTNRFYSQLFSQTAARSPEYVDYRADRVTRTRLRAIAFYLPQYHPIPENDAWWGRGFTEWTNVAKAVPQFVGHYQPRLPGELGHYDLRVAEIRRRQVELARQHGLHGFCFYYYWFSGRRLLERPLDDYIADPAIDFPFCVCWANENWTRRWDGRSDDILMQQLYREEDERAFIDSVIPLLRDARYIRVEGRPLLMVYGVDELPKPERAVATWRRACVEAGVGDPYLVMVQFHTDDPRPFGFDAAVEFPPHLPQALDRVAADGVELLNPDYHGILYDYQAMAEGAARRTRPEYDWYRGVMPSWDNEARKPGRGATFVGASPEAYARWLTQAALETDRHQDAAERKLLFINAWNEWGEAAYLEPDRRYGYAYLAETARVLGSFAPVAQPRIVLVSHNALFHGAQLLALHMARGLRQHYGYEVHILLCGDGPLRADYAREGMVHDWYAMTPDAQVRLAAWLHGIGADRAICNTSVVGDAVACLAGAGIRCLSLVHELPVLIRAQGLEASIASIAAHAERVVFPATYVMDRFLTLQAVPEGHRAVRPQGLYQRNPERTDRDGARARVRQELGLPTDARIVLGVGFSDHRKGIDLFADVAARVCADDPGVRFVWVGTRDELEIARHEAVIAPLVASGHLFLTGARATASVYYAGADLYLLTSREDPFPSVVLEALDVGLPVVAFADGGGYAELLAEGWGDLVAMADCAAMARCVLDRLNRPASEQRAFAESARALIAARYDFSDYLRDLLAMLDVRVHQVSVIVPNYNYARYLEVRLQSILAQTRKPREIIFLDDASSDDSVALAERLLAQSDIPCRIIANRENRGCFRQWDTGIEAAVGDLVWIAEADDIAESGFLEALVPCFEDPEVVLAYSQSSQIDEHGHALAPDYLAYTDDIDRVRWRAPYCRAGTDELRDTLVVKNTIPNVSAVVMRKPDLTPIAAQLHGLRNAGDWLAYAHLLEHGKIAYRPEALNRHRRHSGSLTLGEGRRRLMREIVAVQAEIMRRHPPSADIQALIETVNARTYDYLELASARHPGWRDDPGIADARLGADGLSATQP